jgi:hypothetical protein
VLLKSVRDLESVDRRMADALSDEAIAAIVDLIPGSWIESDGAAAAADVRDAYRRYLIDRLRAPRAFVQEIAGAG